MIIARILLLLLYFNLCSCEPEYKIDLSRCVADMKCFVRKSCTMQTPDAPSEKVLELYNNPNKQKLPDECDAIIQIKSYTKKKYLIMMQVDASKHSKDITPAGVSLIQGPDDTAFQFKCAKNKVDVNPADFKMTKHRATLDGKYLFCAFFFETIDGNEITKKFDNEDISNSITNDHNPTMVFETNVVHRIEYEEATSSFWAKAFIQSCDPDQITSKSDVDATYILHEMDATLIPPLICDPSMALRISINGGDPIFERKHRKITCEVRFWKYYDEATSNFIKVTKPFTAHCVEKLCTLCSPLPALDCGSACSQSSKIDEADKCPTLTCPATNNVWQLDGGKEVSGELECKKDGGTNNAAWFFKDGTAHPDKVDKAACFNKEICWTTAAFVEDCPPEPEKIPEGMECVKTLNKANRNSELSCPEGQELRWFAPPTDEIKPDATKITCDFATAKFKDSGNIEVVANSRVVCLRKKDETPTGTASMSRMNTAVLIFTLILLLA